ncbi:hypothetical protein EVAR_88312_1 [Eumeta japonica]|uniref:Uncharacterized protein n=1 Tax=Eumeta variegata TaxID=151549 RepID=A0A4C1VMQ7_EUMVA|nr:hypothetical protein EVAR_88312_1 [Eumeta japonica]
MHNMLSTTVDSRVRGDENMCNQLSQYRAMRVPRSAGTGDDVEILDSSFLENANKNGHLKQYSLKDDVEYTGYDGTPSERQILNTNSQCPILTGAINTPYGALSAGNLIAGIAAGSEAQSVPITELVKGSPLTYTDVSSTVSSIFPATISGDLAEAALMQGVERGANTVTVGVVGGWNSTQARKHYLLQSNTNLEMTDPEMRGDIDGYILGNIIRTSSANMRLSQLLDMYYAPRNGIFDPALRACNRRQLLETYLDTNTLTTQTYTFAAALDTHMPLRGTITGGLRELVVSAVNNFQQYSNNDLPNLNCHTVENGNPDFRTRTNLYLVLDSSWPYETIYPAISYLLDMIEVGKYGSSVTLLNALNGGVVVNTTFSLAEFHTQYTVTDHHSMTFGVNLENSFINIRTMMLDQLDREQRTSYTGGNSTVLLFLLNSGIENNDRVWNEARLLNDTVPDLRILFATSNNQYDSLWNLVRDVHQDIKTISLTSTATNIDTVMNPVLERIRMTGRRIVNPNCGSQWTSNSLSGTRQFTDYIEPGYVNYYAVSPNYFYQNNQNTKVRITRTGGGVGTFVVCFSRVLEQPRQNATTSINPDDNIVHCEQISSMSGSVEFSLNDACGAYWTINTCPRLFISVESIVSSGTTTSSICTENACRFPYNIRYNVQYEDFGCYSGSTRIAANFLVALIAFGSILRLI